MRCFWCDSDKFEAIIQGGSQVAVEALQEQDLTAVDYICLFCGHLVSEGNPRDGDPEETVDTVKDERDDLRTQLEACLGQQAEASLDRVEDNSIESNT